MHTENLIIDLQNNGEGSDFSYEKLLPIIYTTSISKIGIEFLSTPLNNQRMVDMMNDPELPEHIRNLAKNALNIFNKHIG
jgi:hypothetical protein